jgi:hypothetical protein
MNIGKGQLGDVMKGASRTMYVCRPYADMDRIAAEANVPLAQQLRAVQRMKCVDCGAAIAVTPTVLADRRRIAHEAGVKLAVVCDDCGRAEMLKAPLAFVAMPSSDEIRESQGR